MNIDNACLNIEGGNSVSQCRLISNACLKSRRQNTVSAYRCITNYCLNSQWWDSASPFQNITDACMHRHGWDIFSGQLAILLMLAWTVKKGTLLAHNYISNACLSSQKEKIVSAYRNVANTCLNRRGWGIVTQFRLIANACLNRRGVNNGRSRLIWKNTTFISASMASAKRTNDVATNSLRRCANVFKRIFFTKLPHNGWLLELYISATSMVVSGWVQCTLMANL